MGAHLVRNNELIVKNKVVYFKNAMMVETLELVQFIED